MEPPPGFFRSHQTPQPEMEPPRPRNTDLTASMDIARNSPSYLRNANILLDQDQAPIAKLPTEIIQQIVGYLPISSEATFALSCKLFCLSVGTTSFQHMKSADQKYEADKLLILLSRDMDDFIACSTCLKLHRVDRYLRVVPEECEKSAGYFPTLRRSLSTVSIHFHELRAIMQNPSMRSTATVIPWSKSPRLGVAYYDTIHCRKTDTPRICVDYKIIESRLIVKQRIDLRRDIESMAHRTRGGLWMLHGEELVLETGKWCHISEHQALIDTSTKALNMERPQHQDPSQKIFVQSPHYRCRYCPREVMFSTTIRADGNSSVACYLTMLIWTDLGAGEPGDERWTRVRADNPFHMPWYQRLPYSDEYRPEWQYRHSIKETYEQSENRKDYLDIQPLD